MATSDLHCKEAVMSGYKEVPGARFIAQVRALLKNGRAQLFHVTIVEEVTEHLGQWCEKENFFRKFFLQPTCGEY